MSKQAIGNSRTFPIVGQGVIARAESSARESVTEPLSSRLSTERPWGSLVAWAGAVGSGAWALFRLTGADRIPGLDLVVVPLISLTPYAAAASPLPVVI